MDSPLAYIGGKSQLAPTIINYIPDHKQYCEVFAGGLWVFFAKEPSKYEVVNDLDSNLITLYRVLQNHLEEFLKQFKWLLSSREWFQDWKDQQDVRGLTDIQRAARYYYLQRLAFGGRVRSRSYGTAPMDRPRINLLRMEEELSAVHLRLTNVTIENLSWDQLIKRYDRPESFLYCDPPYYKAPYYNHNMDLADFQQMAEMLKDIDGKFLLSLNDHADIRKTFRSFYIKGVDVQYSVAKAGPSTFPELLISNYDLDEVRAAPPVQLGFDI